MGFNSETGLAVGTALEGFTVSTNSAAPGQEVTSSISIITSHEELQKTLVLDDGYDFSPTVFVQAVNPTQIALKYAKGDANNHMLTLSECSLIRHRQ